MGKRKKPDLFLQLAREYRPEASSGYVLWKQGKHPEKSIRIKRVVSLAEPERLAHRIEWEAKIENDKVNREVERAAKEEKRGKIIDEREAKKKLKFIVRRAEKRKPYFSSTTIRAGLLADLGGCCQRCGYSEFTTSLHFHHKEPSAKEANVSVLIVSYCNLPTDDKFEKLRAEVAKCMLLCANCHNSLHAKHWTLNA